VSISNRGGLTISTMPSTLPDSIKRFTTAEISPPPVPATSTTSTPIRTSALSPAYPTTPSTRPTLRHTTSSSANLETPTGGTANRLRSGSLTLPQDNLGNAFGSSPFSSAWISNPGQARSPLAPHPGTEESDYSSYTMPSDGNATSANDELNFSTLDYLGLADGGELVPASVSGLRAQAQRAIANSGPASRLRASTVSNVNRPIRPSVTSSASSSYDRSEEAALARAIGELGMYEDNGYEEQQSLYHTGMGFQKDSRPRATTIGHLDNPHRRNVIPAGYLSSIPQSPVQGSHMQAHSLSSVYGYPPRSRSDRDLNRSRDSSINRGPRMSASSHTSRAGTPDVAGTSTPQMPTRSLWIGNLDVNATSDALLHVFSPYGAIESVRMLPEKVSRGTRSVGLSLTVRLALLSTLWKNQTQSKQEMTYLIDWVDMCKLCPRLLLFASVSVRLILLQPVHRRRPLRRHRPVSSLPIPRQPQLHQCQWSFPHPTRTL